MIPLRSARAVALLTLASRVLGMVREVAFASIFGAGVAADAFRIAFQLPNTFRKIFGEGALTSALVPILSGLKERAGTEALARAAGAVLGTLALALAALVALGIAGVGVLAPRLVGLADDPEKARLTAVLTALLLPYLFLICMTAAQAAVLNVVDAFAIPALSPILFNGVDLLGLGLAAVWAAKGFPGGATGAIYVLAGAVLVAGAVQYASQAWGLRRAGLAARKRLDWGDPAVAEIRRGMLPMVIGLAPAQVGVLVDSWMAELWISRDGPVAHLGYAHVLVHLPIALVAVSIATVSFPLFSRLAARSDRAGLSEAAATACRQVLFLLLPATAGLAMLSVPIVRLVYERGRFDSAATGFTAATLQCYAAGLVAFGLQQVVTRLLYASGDRRTPVLASAASVALNVLLNLWWVGRYEERGIAMATAVSAWAGLAWTGTAAWSRLRDRGGARAAGGGGGGEDGGGWRGLLPLAVATAALVVFLQAVNAAELCRGEGLSFALRAAAAIGGGAAIFLGVAWILGAREIRELLARSAAPGAGADPAGGRDGG